MIPIPNLDDRKWEELVEEAVRLIPQYCPEWTNFNKSDPGVTLLELFAWMTELAIYRLNQVPEKNYLAFLNMMGVRLRPPQPARGLVHFDVSPKVDQVRIEQGTRLATKPSGDEPPLTFETERAVLAITNKLVRCMSQFEQNFSDNTEHVDGERGPFEVFGGARSIERFLYVGDDRLGAFNEDSVCVFRFEGQSGARRPFHDLLEWEYWDGGRWRELARPSMTLDQGCVAFQGPPVFEPTTVNGIETAWLRGRLFDVPRGDEETVIDTVSTHLEVLGDGVTPEWAILNAEGNSYRILDLDKNFRPLGKAPAIDATLYIGANELFGQEDTTIRLTATLSPQTVAEAPRPSADLMLRWEYHNGKRWKLLAKVKADGTIDSDHDFEDETRCFSQSGVIEFRRPKDLSEVDVNGNKALFIRCRVEHGDYGVPGSYQLEQDTWVYKDDNPLRPPSLKSLEIKYIEDDHELAHCLVYNDFVFTDHSKTAATEYKPFQAFAPVAEESPTLFLGWEHPFPNAGCAVYFNVIDLDGRGGRDALRSFEDRIEAFQEQRVVWEYWSGKSWSPLAPKDTTENFTQAGFIEFVGPADFRKSRRFGESLYWMRARLEMGGYVASPRVDRVLLNAVYAHNVTTYGDTPLGSSKGTPNQSFYIPNGPVLDGEQIVVREPDKPKPEEIQNLISAFGDEAIVRDPDGEGWWVRYLSVDSFFDQTGKDRTYIKDIGTGEICFGDGKRGAIPPRGDKNVRALRYQVGGGAPGNVPAASISVMKQTLAFVNEVSNPYAAVGGCDMESVEDAKLRAPHMLKARNRAVTIDDFEWLAREASNTVARVKCLPAAAREGEVTVIVVPKAARDGSLKEKPVPTTELLKKVRAYLSERKLVSTVVNVVRPAYLELSLRVEIVRVQTSPSDRVKRDVEGALRAFLHPLYGGRNGRGWPFGRSVLKVDLYHVAEQVDGVDFVDKIRFTDEETGFEVEQLKLRDDELVFLVNVTVIEKAHDRIV